MNLLKTCYDAIKPYFVYVPVVSSISGLFALFKNDEALPLRERSIIYIDPHEKAKTAISVIPIVGNVIVALVDIAEKLFPANKVEPQMAEDKEIDRLNVELGKKQERLEEKENIIKELKAEIEAQERRLSEASDQLCQLRQKISSDKNPDIIVALAGKNKELVEEIKGKQSELEVKEAQFKKLEAEHKRKERNVLSEDLHLAEQKIEKLKSEIAAKNAVSELCATHLKATVDIPTLESALCMLWNFRLEDVSAEEYVLASRFNTALSKIRLLSTYIEWRLKPHRNLFVAQLEMLSQAVSQAMFLYESLHTKFRTNNLENKVDFLKEYQKFVIDVLEDEKVIANGKNEIQHRIRELDASYVLLNDSELIAKWREVPSGESYRIGALKVALWNMVRRFDENSLDTINFDDELNLQALQNEINDKFYLMEVLLLSNRRRCIHEITYLKNLVDLAVSAFERMINKTNEQKEEHDELKYYQPRLKEALEDERIIDLGNEAIEARIRSLDSDYADYTREQLLDLKSHMHNDEQPFRMKMLLTALKEPS